MPEHWIDSLFAKMTAFYGSAFSRMWHDANTQEVRKAWGIELFKLSPAQLRAGVNSLAASFPMPPTLPQFIAHCRQARRDEAASSPALTDQRRSDANVYAAGMANVRNAAKTLAAKRPSGVAWAHRLLERGTSASGSALPDEVIRCAREAIANYSRVRGGR